MNNGRTKAFGDDDMFGGKIPDEYPDECQNCGVSPDPFFIPDDWSPRDGTGVCTECGRPFGGVADDD